jgi:site-specific DNA recombinase
MRYILYARKSSEDEDRQVQSIPDQINRLKELAKNQGLKITAVMDESKSAKIPNNRPIFREVLEMIQRGEADALLAWQVNRLSRNPVDSGQLQWMMQSGSLKRIQTIEREYRPEDSAMLLGIEASFSNQFILDLSKNVRRGMTSKAQKGGWPGTAPIGYLNERTRLGEAIIVKDPQRFNIVRKMWDMMLTGAYTPRQILEAATDEWGLRTRQTRKNPSLELSLSRVYTMFRSQFYAGVIEYNGEVMEKCGEHPAMITLDEFDRVQMILGSRGRPRYQKHQFAYTGFIRCGECGASITALKKRKLNKTTNKIKYYTYYRCTGRKRHANCSQKASLTEQELEKQITAEVSNLTILPEFRDWALNVINNMNDREIDDRTSVHENLNKTLLATQKQLDELTRMRYRGMVDDDEFLRERNKLKAEIEKLRTELRRAESRADQWLDLTEKTFNFATHARYWFQHGDINVKKEVLMALGQNPTIRDRKLSFTPNEWLQPIAEKYPALEQKYQTVRTDQKMDSKKKKEAFASISADWYAWQDSNLRPLVPETNALSS